MTAAGHSAMQNLPFLLLLHLHSVPWYLCPVKLLCSAFICYLFWCAPCPEAALSFGPCIAEHSGPFLTGWLLCWSASWGLLAVLAGGPPPLSTLLANTAFTNRMSALWPDTHSLKTHCLAVSDQGESYSIRSCGFKSRYYFLTKCLEKPNPRKKTDPLYSLFHFLKNIF